MLKTIHHQMTIFPFLIVLFAAILAVILRLPTQAFAQSQTTGSPATRPTSPPWVERSNANAKLLVEVFARFNPELAGQLGAEGVDELIIDLKPGYSERSNQATEEVIKVLRDRLAVEKDPQVRQDLEILIKAGEDGIKGTNLSNQYLLPYFNVAESIFLGIRALLDDQTPPERRQSALVRLKRYAGIEPGYTPLPVLAEQRTRERFSRPELLGPSKAEVQKNLSNSALYIDGIGQLFQQYSIKGYEDAYSKLKEQSNLYDVFVRNEILPKARSDFRLPAPLYEFSLEQKGIRIPAADLIRQAHAGFVEIQKEMQDLAVKVAKEKGLKVSDYRDVIRELKKNQLVGEAILPHYEKRIKEIESIIQREKLVTLPHRPMRIRLASEAESAMTPAPHVRPPRLLGNTGEIIEFVLPLNIPAPPGSKESTQKFDDFTFDAASWTLTVHEGRPGHELQFSSIIEGGVSTARALFAFNSVNVEGWGLYAEKVMQPFEPLDGQLIALQHRLMRAARAFLDPELQLGKIQPEDARQILMKDVVLSDAMVNQEVERYTFLAPGQAPSYFYGYSLLTQLRKEVEKTQGSNFNQLQYHDFILDQGLLPLDLLRQVVLERFK